MPGARCPLPRRRGAAPSEAPWPSLSYPGNVLLQGIDGSPCEKGLAMGGGSRPKWTARSPRRSTERRIGSVFAWVRLTMRSHLMSVVCLRGCALRCEAIVRTWLRGHGARNAGDRTARARFYFFTEMKNTTQFDAILSSNFGLRGVLALPRALYSGRGN